MNKIKSIILKSAIFLINVTLVVGGIFFLKNQQEKSSLTLDANDNATDGLSISDLPTAPRNVQSVNNVASQNYSQPNSLSHDHPVQTQIKKAVSASVQPMMSSTKKSSATTSSSRIR